MVLLDANLGIKMPTIFTDNFDAPDLSIEISSQSVGNRCNELIIENGTTEVRLSLLDGQLNYLANVLSGNGFDPDYDQPKDATHFANKTWWCHIPKHNRLDKWECGCWKMQNGNVEDIQWYRDYRSV